MTLTVADISHWQENVDYGAFIRAGGAGFIAKAGQANLGVLWRDSMYTRHIQGTRAAGGRTGHYMMNGSVPVSRVVDYFLGIVMPVYIPGEPLVIDVEAIDGDRAWFPGEVHEFFDRIRPEVDLLNGFAYMNDAVLDAHDWSGVVAPDVRLWKAAWGSDNPDPGAWPSVTIHQWTDKGVFGGFKGDLNHAADDTWRARDEYIDGTVAEFRDMLRSQVWPIRGMVANLAASHGV